MDWLSKEYNCAKNYSLIIMINLVTATLRQNRLTLQRMTLQSFEQTAKSVS